MKNKYQDIADKLQKQITGGEYTGKLPSEPELAQKFATATITVRKALDLLQQRGMIRKVPYVGNFVETQNLRKVKICWQKFPLTDAADREIRAAVTGHFRDFEVEFVDMTNQETIADCDIIRIVATTRLPYHDYAMALPSSLCREFQNGNYYQEPFRTHQANNIQYALPFMFSPSVLMMNTRLLDGFGRKIGLYDLNWRLLEETRQYATERRCRLWSAQVAAGLLRGLIFTKDTKGELWRVNLSELRQEIHEVWPLLCEPTGEKNEVIFNWGCRQQLPYWDPQIYRICTYPFRNNGEPMLNPVSGEFLMVSANSPVQSEALEVLRYFLSADIQQIIAAHRAGLPVLKETALQSMAPSNPLDNVFINEIAGMQTNNAMEQDFQLRLRSMSESIRSDELNEKQFIERLEYEIGMAKYKKNVHNQVFDNYTASLAGI